PSSELPFSEHPSSEFQLSMYQSSEHLSIHLRTCHVIACSFMCNTHCVCNVCGKIVASSGRRVLEVIEANYLSILSARRKTTLHKSYGKRVTPIKAHLDEDPS